MQHRASDEATISACDSLPPFPVTTCHSRGGPSVFLPNRLAACRAEVLWNICRSIWKFRAERQALAAHGDVARIMRDADIAVQPCCSARCPGRGYRARCTHRSSARPTQYAVIASALRLPWSSLERVVRRVGLGQQGIGQSRERQKGISAAVRIHLNQRVAT